MNEEKEQKNDQASSSIDQLKKELEACLVKRDEWKDKYLRAVADFENFKKRLQKEQAELIPLGQAAILKEIIIIVDDFGRALEEKRKEGLEQSLEPWFKGFELINKELVEYLNKIGVEEVATSEGFNPAFHEALMHIESEDHEPGQIVEILQKGYMFKGHLLRPAQVSIAK